MRCPSCDHESPPDARFCMHCGSVLAASCIKCAAELPAEARFCPSCGEPVGAAAPAGKTQILPERDPRPYTPRHLAEKILRSGSALEGERKHVTVMFADVKGSMELAEQLDPEQWHQVLDRFFEILTEGVHRFEGTVNQYTGDGVMALFGAPIAHEDHAERACYAALHIRDAVRKYARDVRAEHGVPFGVRVGLNSGEVVVGKIGDDLRMDYTAQGHTVGLAQRMEALAESGHICLSENTARHVEGFFELTDLGRTKVKGAEAPVGLFDLEGLGAFRTRLDRSRARGMSAFVGRDADMAVLEAALVRAQNGHGQVLGLSADAGTGKSRLCAEFIDKHRARRIPVLEARGVAHGKSIPMLPMLELWRAFYGIGENDSAEATRAKIAGRLLLMDDSFREMLPIIFDVLGVPDPEHPALPMDAEQRQKRLRAVIKQVLHDPGYGGTRIILLEDLHWFDGASDGFLETIVESVPATRDLLLVNFRPEYQASWMQRSYYQHLQLQPLDQEAIRELLRNQLGDDPSVAKLPAAIHERTKGNPFFTEEVVQAMIERGQLVGERGAYRLTTTIDTLEVPASVQSVLAARIDRLPERDKQVLQTAAVIGKTFAEALLREVVESVAGLDEKALGQSLSDLAAAEFLFESSLYPQLEYAFKHPLTQEVAEGSQLRERRMRVHAAVAHALEATGLNLDEHAAEIGQHWAEAGEFASAARWHRRAAEWAGLSDPREGLRHWERVRELVKHLENEPEWDELALQACIQIMQLGWRLGRSDAESASIFAEGRALAERSGDKHGLARVVSFYGLVRNMQAGSATDYIRYGEEGAAIAAETGDTALMAGIGTLPAFGYLFSGEGQPLLDAVERVLDVTGPDNALGREISGYSPRAGMLHARAVALCYLGRLEEAWRSAHEAERAAEEAGDQEVLGWALEGRVYVHLLAGRSGSALDVATRCSEIAEKIDNESSRVIACLTLGMAHLSEGNFAAARDAFAEANAIARENRMQLGSIPLSLAMLAQSHLGLGNTDEAAASAREAIELAHAGGGFLYEAQAQNVLAATLLEAEGAAAAAEVEAALERAEQLVESVNSRVMSPQILETRARLQAARGDEGAARHTLRQAAALYREIGAHGHAERLVPTD